MKKVKTECLQGGEILARAVENDSGIVLYGAGAEVTETMIRKLESLSVEAVRIEGAHETRMSRDAYLEHLEGAFRRAGDDGLMGRLRRIMDRHVAALYPENP